MSDKIIVKIETAFENPTVTEKYFPETLTKVFEFNGVVSASDGYHTFEELYDHRITLFIMLCRTLNWIDEINFINSNAKNITKSTIINDVWRSKLHSDGSSFDGWFIMGIGKKAGEQKTYHLPIGRWNETNFAETLEKAPEWDGHTPADVLERLKNI